MSEQVFQQVLEVLRSRTDQPVKNWNHRYRMNMEKIRKPGDIFALAEVVRTLSQRDRGERGLSTGERKMLDNARQGSSCPRSCRSETFEPGAGQLTPASVLAQRGEPARVGSRRPLLSSDQVKGANLHPFYSSHKQGALFRSWRLPICRRG